VYNIIFIAQCYCTAYTPCYVINKYILSSPILTDVTPIFGPAAVPTPVVAHTSFPAPIPVNPIPAAVTNLPGLVVAPDVRGKKMGQADVSVQEISKKLEFILS